MRELSIGNRVNVRTKNGFLMEGTFWGVEDGLVALEDVTWTEVDVWQPESGTMENAFIPTTNISWITQRNTDEPG